MAMKLATPLNWVKAHLGRRAFPELSVDEVAARLGQPGFFVYDANHAETYVQGHVPGARLVAYDDLPPGVLPADKKATLVFYCASPT